MFVFFVVILCEDSCRYFIRGFFSPFFFHENMELTAYTFFFPSLFCFLTNLDSSLGGIEFEGIKLDRRTDMGRTKACQQIQTGNAGTVCTAL
jgi:hypothetical protein